MKNDEQPDYRKHFKLKLYVYRRPNLRDDALEYEMYMGLNILRNIFDDMETFKDESVFLSFPERWLNIIEQRQLYFRLCKYGINLKEVTIKTHSVYLVQMTHKKDCLILTNDKYRDSMEDDPLDQKLWLPNPGNIFDLDKLNVLGGSIKEN